MAEVLPLPNGQALARADSDKLHRPGEVFADVRADQRGMRVSYHRDADVLVISLWAGRTCRATFQLAGTEVARLSTLLAEVLAATDKASDGGNPGPVALAS